MALAAAKRLEWAPRALDSYLETLSRISEQDAESARLVAERVERALRAIQAQPGIGTAAARRGERRFPVPQTGHVLNYRVLRHAIRIQLWYRARRHLGR